MFCSFWLLEIALLVYARLPPAVCKKVGISLERIKFAAGPKSECFLFAVDEGSSSTNGDERKVSIHSLDDLAALSALKRVPFEIW
jgi:hypothetical protein